MENYEERENATAAGAPASTRSPLHQLHSYLALGDSYTIGEGVETAGTWPFQLAAALRAQGIDLDDPQVIATTGWSTDELAAAMDEAAPQGPFALVSLLIGVNNQYRGRPLAEFRQQFEQLLQRAIALAAENPARVLVLSIPDWGITPYARDNQRDALQIAQEIDDFNAAARACCGDYGVAFVDITAASRDDGDLPSMLVGDGLHPSVQMYRRWTQLALPVAAQLLPATPRA